LRKRFLIVLFAVILLVGCGRQAAPPTPAPGPEKPRPEVIQAWIEDSRTIFLGQSKELDGTLYLLVTYGEKPTGGYVVEIGDVIVAADKVTVPVRFKKPAPGDMVTQALTYPYDLEAVKATGVPVEFVPSGDEEYLPALVGIDELQPIVAGSAGVKIFAPLPESMVSRKFVLEGVANVFEGNVQYKLLDGEGRLLDRGFTTAAMGDWGYFRADLSVPEEVAAGKSLLLDVFTVSAKDGSLEQQILYEIVLR